MPRLQPRNLTGPPQPIHSAHFRYWQIVLQKSQNAARLNFRQRTKQAVIVDRCSLKRATEVANKFVTE
jgi:hypothetical protein